MKKYKGIYILPVWDTSAHHLPNLWTMEEIGTVTSWASPIYTFFDGSLLIYQKVWKTY